MYLEEFVEVSLKLVDPNSCGDKRPWEVERSGYCLVSTWILVAFKHLERLICFDETITIVKWICLHLQKALRLTNGKVEWEFQQLQVTKTKCTGR